MTPGEYLDLYLKRNEIPRWKVIKRMGISKAYLCLTIKRPEWGMTLKLAMRLEAACGVNAKTLLALEVDRLRAAR